VDTFTWPVRVYYEDTDSGGLVYHANYLKFMERARTEWLRRLGFEQRRLHEELGVIFTVRSLDIDYRKPAHFDDALRVSARVTEQRGASLVFEQAIAREQALEDTLVRATVKVACVDAATLKPRAIPETIKTEIANVG